MLLLLLNVLNLGHRCGKLLLQLALGPRYLLLLALATGLRAKPVDGVPGASRPPLVLGGLLLLLRLLAFRFSRLIILHQVIIFLDLPIFVVH